MSACDVIAKVYRGHHVESVHYGAAAVVDAEGRLIASVSDPDFRTYSRSSLKPFQATPTVARGAVERFGLADRHVALICGSHNGEKRHVTAAAEILAAIGCTEDEFNCGVHEPYIYRMRAEKPAPGTRFSQLYNNCSGKHSGMLMLCRLLNVSTVNYLDFDHPIQQVIRQMVIDVTGLRREELGMGIDGCTAPNYTMPLRALARAYARLVTNRGPDDNSSAAMGTIVRAMQAEPGMVSGEGRYDLALAETAGDRLICKVGGEAVECIGLLERGWGVAVTVADGGTRAIGVAATEILRQLGVLSEEEVARLQPFSRPMLTNHRKIITGSIRPALRIQLY